MSTKKDSYLRIRITANEKAELKSFVESNGTTLTAYLKTLLDSKLNSKVNTTFV